MTIAQINKEIKAEMKKRKDYEEMGKLQKTDFLKGLILDGTMDAIKGLNRYGTLEARTIICRLKQDYYPIATKTKKIRNRYGTTTSVAEYYLTGLPKGYSNRLKRLVKERYKLLDDSQAK